MIDRRGIPWARAFPWKMVCFFWKMFETNGNKAWNGPASITLALNIFYNKHFIPHHQSQSLCYFNMDAFKRFHIWCDLNKIMASESICSWHLNISVAPQCCSDHFVIIYCPLMLFWPLKTIAARQGQIMIPAVLALFTCGCPSGQSFWHFNTTKSYAFWCLLWTFGIDHWSYLDQ